jgi:septal ring-binding cell division protein DamX
MKGEQLKLFEVQERGSKKVSLLFPIDTAGLFSVIIVLLIIFSYILGVERGKRAIIAEYGLKTPKNAVIVKAPESSQPKPAAPVRNQSAEITAKTVAPENKSLPVGKYTIQLASYKYQTAADREKKVLENKGFAATIVKKGDYWALLVGVYKTRDAALMQISKLKKQYKDCFIMRL